MSNKNRHNLSFEFFGLLFEVAWGALIILQLLPIVAIVHLDSSHCLFWVCWALGIGAMTIQSIKFPCHSQIIFRAAMIACWIGTMFGQNI